MQSYECARVAADHLRAKSEVGRSQPALLTTFLAAASASAAGEDQTAWWWYLGLAAGLLLLPPLLRRLLPRGGLTTHRLEFVAYPLNALLLGFILFIETSKLPPLNLEELPALAWLYPVLTVAGPLAYLAQQFPGWRRRVKAYRNTLQALRTPGDPEVLDEVAALVVRASAAKAPEDPALAEFRTVPAAPRNWSRFLRLDVERHGLWRAAFAQDYALVIAADGTEVEAVPRGGLRIVAEDPLPGNRPFLCLVRWNAHLKEGRIREDSLQRIQAWNTRTVPEPT